MSIAIPAVEPQPGHQVPLGAVAPTGRLRHAGLSETDRNFGIAMHLTPFAAIVFGPLIFTPLVLWLMHREKSSFADDHGREVINFGLSYFILSLLFVWTGIVPVILGIVAVVNLIRGAVAASNGEYFRYPLTIRFLS